MMVVKRGNKATRRWHKVEAQVCVVAGVLAVAWGASALLAGVGHIMVLSSKSDILSTESRDLHRRRLLADDDDGDNTTALEINCTEPAIHQFPPDVFSNRQRHQGAVVLHILAALYMFLALAIICDDYFVVSLEKICEKLDLSEDVAGATFMAAGSSAPELFASVIGVFITRGDVGVGTIVGSAVFNILCIIGVCGLFAGQVVPLTKYALFRDSLCYTLSVLALIAIIYDGQIEWWESLLLVLMYAGYILIMKFNSSLQFHLSGGRGKKTTMANGNAAFSTVEEGNNDCYGDCYHGDDPSKPLLQPGTASQPYTGAGLLSADQMIDSGPLRYSFPEAGLRLMITNHFSPKTRLCMASRLIIHQRLTKDYNSMPMTTVKEREADSRLLTESIPLHGSSVDKLKCAISWPILFLLYISVPDCSQPQWEKYFLLTFLGATLWIGAFSYIMVWMVTIIGYTLGIPDVIMGITFLAAGTSVPDCISSLLVARQGRGDMAVSNSIGSNVFDILVGLGLPWSIQTLAVRWGSQVLINSRGIVYSVVLLLGSMALTILGIHANGWRLDVRLGACVLLLYIVFLSVSVLIEYNVFTFINLPMCFEE